MSGPGLIARARATGRLWNTALVVVDLAVIVAATYIAYFARFEDAAPEPFARFMAPLAGASTVVFIALFTLAGLYRLLLRYVGVDTLLRLAGAVAAGSLLLLAADILMPMSAGMRPVPVGVLFIQGLLVFLGSAAARMAARIVLYLRALGVTEGRRVLIVGAGSAGSLLLREIQARPDRGLAAVGFLDDDPALTGKRLGGVAVLGTTDGLADTVARFSVEEIVVALPSAPQERVRALLNTAADLGVETRVMPPLVIAKGSVSLRDLRPVEVEDLLGREPTSIDVDQVRGTIAGKAVAVTGAAGSIGAELCRQVVTLAPSRLVLLDIDESRLYELWLELEKSAPGTAEMRVCDVRDAAKLESVFAADRPDVVLHAAAYKHVPLMELEPAEAVRTNVGGTVNVLRASQRHGVSRFVLISTDKAVAPTNVMGRTKRLAELAMLDAAGTGGLNAVAVRFGNVLGSRGSVVPIFEEQLRHGGPLTVTDPEVTRYFMTIPEASRLVLQAQAIGTAGDIFVLEMGEPVALADLARKMIALSGVPADIEFVGLRPGEKLHETLAGDAERLVPTNREKILRVERAPETGAPFSELVAGLLAAAEAADDQTVRSLLGLLDGSATDAETPEV